MNHKQNKSSKSFFALFFSKYFWSIGPISIGLH